MKARELSILKSIGSSKEISLYTLAESIARKRKRGLEDVFDYIVKEAYILASKGLIEINANDGEDGLETFLKITGLGKTYIKSEQAR